MTAIELIAAERQRQVDVEGYDAQHDAGHARQLALAAATYAMPADFRDTHVFERTLRYIVWPWSERHWKPTPDDRMRELVKAGALIVAAIDST